MRSQCFLFFIFFPLGCVDVWRCLCGHCSCRSPLVPFPVEFGKRRSLRFCLCSLTYVRRYCLFSPTESIQESNGACDTSFLSSPWLPAHGNPLSTAVIRFSNAPELREAPAALARALEKRQMRLLNTLLFNDRLAFFLRNMRIGSGRRSRFASLGRWSSSTTVPWRWDSTLPCWDSCSS